MSDIYGTTTIILDRGNYTQCTIHLFGANITSWRIHNIEQLFVSTQAIMDGTIPIRGGIPVVFPQYGSWTFGPHHGFARIMEWKVKQFPTKLENNDVEVILYLEDDYFSRSMWNYSFRMEYRIVLLEADLKLSIRLCNTHKEDIIYTNILMHPYIRVPNITDCKIVGLESEYIDKTTDEIGMMEVPIARIYDQTDRVYKNTRHIHIITNVMNNRNLKIEKENCPDTVIWNPWSDQARKLVDFDEDDYLRMVCLAAGYASQRLQILPNHCEQIQMTLKLRDHLLPRDSTVFAYE